MGKLLVIAGVALAAVGLLLMWGLPLGRLPGDFTYRRGGTTVYVPLATSIVASLILTLLFALFRR